MKFIFFFLLVLMGLSAKSQDLVYQPANPSFGGNPYNYSWLLNSANAQNTFKDPESFGLNNKSDLEQFTSQLNSQLLNQISRRLFNQQFGEDSLTPGSYTFGSLAIDIFPSSEGLVITILDTNTGEQTQIIIPGN